MRIHPLLDWTELNVWEYIEREHIPTVSLYYNQGDGTRYRSLGCAPCTKPIRSESRNVHEIIEELRTGALSNIAERSGRAQDARGRRRARNASPGRVHVMEETRNVWENEELLNIVTVGHVDHGKSTVIGRLLADARSAAEGQARIHTGKLPPQLEAVRVRLPARRTAQRAGSGHHDRHGALLLQV